MDYSRQTNLLSHHFFNGKSVTVIGAGATGSYVIMQLAQHGFGDPESKADLRVFDGDVVEEHNLPNQAFMLKHIGESKALSMNDLVKEKMGFEIECHNEMVDDSTDKNLISSDVVFILTDTMKSRKEIFEKFIANNPSIELVIETRMNLTGGMIYAFDPRDQMCIDKWKGTLYTDEDAQVSACGMSQTTVSTAVRVATIAVNRWVQHAMSWMPDYDMEKAQAMWNETHVNLYSDQFYLSSWDKEEQVITNVYPLL